MTRRSLLQALAAAFLAGEQTEAEILARGALTTGRKWPWMAPLATAYLREFAGQTRPRRRDVVDFLLRDEGLNKAFKEHRGAIFVAQRLTGAQKMQPAAAAAMWDLPVIETSGALAKWLRLEGGELDWFADRKQLEGRTARAQLQNYRYRVLIKRSGRVRLIEAPKPRLKEAQRQILHQILEAIPPHPAAHGFLKGRSIQTFAAPHAGQNVVLRMDLQDFFPFCGTARIQALFRTMGYPESVADALGGICTSAAPRGVWKECPPELDRALVRDARALYSRSHLPQGAPTSPALANLCAFRVDCRLAGLAKSAGAAYTRYADDLAFSASGEFERRAERFADHVAAVLREEGFAANHHKTRIMRKGARRHLAGLVVNERVNIRREDFDRLRATLTNCVRHGPESQNRGKHSAFRAHLEGRVGFMESVNPAKAKRLRAVLDQIRWT